MPRRKSRLVLQTRISTPAMQASPSIVAFAVPDVANTVRARRLTMLGCVHGRQGGRWGIFATLTQIRRAADKQAQGTR